MVDLATLHPLIVHAPLVLLPVAVLFGLLSMIWPRTGLRLAAILLLLGGVGGAMLATATGEEAEERAEQISPAAEDIRVSGAVPQAVAGGNLLETHAELGEMTRNLYGLLLLAEAGLLFASLPLFARWRRGWSLPARAERLARGAWLVVATAGIALIVLTGHYGGALVYDHAVGVAHSGVSGGPDTPANAADQDTD